MFKSKTINFAYLLAVFGILETNFGLISTYLGKWQGLVYVGIAIAVAVLRIVTTQPLSEK